jgi:hypothetical protein
MRLPCLRFVGIDCRVCREGMQRGYAQRTAVQTSLGDVIFDLRWFKIGTTRSKKLESFLEAT